MINDLDIRFSVLTTVFNKAEHVAEAIESVLQQSYENFELILVDDCSSDDSLKIARKFAAKDSRVKVFENESNLGDYPNRNKAISLASFEHLKFLDADDVMQRDALKTYAEVVRAAGQSEPLYYFHCQVSSMNGLFRLTELDARDCFRRGYVAGMRMFHAAPNSCLYRKSVFDRHGAFRVERMTGDYEMAHRLAFAGPVGLVETPKVLSSWRLHANQESQSNRTDLSVASDYVRISLKYLELAKNFFSQEEFRNIRRSRIRIEAQRFRSALGSCEIGTVLRVHKNLNFSLLTILPYVFRAHKLQ